MSDYDEENFEQVLEQFNYADLAATCALHETEFVKRFGLKRTKVKGVKFWDDDYDPFYAFKDNGSQILAVAHLDTVVRHKTREASFTDTADGPVIFSGALDDRLGAYTILQLLPALGINVDVLLTTGEESGQSTAQDFTPPREYNWMIEFDRGGTDVVMYQYEDTETKQMVKATGADVGIGIFSDISYMDFLEIKGFNWGVGYQDYHGPRSHAFLMDYWQMVAYYLDFHERNADVYLPHDRLAKPYSRYGDWSSTWGWDSDGWDRRDAEHAALIDTLDEDDEDTARLIARLESRSERDWPVDDYEAANAACLAEADAGITGSSITDWSQWQEDRRD